MSKTYIGIDPGAKGFISIQHPSGAWDFISLLDANPADVAKKLENLTALFHSPMCVMEDVHAIYGSSAKGTFNFGYIKGFLVGLLTAYRIPYVLVPPKTWQKEMWTHSDEVSVLKDKRKVIDTKNTSINACKRLFPTLDLRRTPACKNIDDNKVDSILMAEYARRKNL